MLNFFRSKKSSWRCARSEFGENCADGPDSNGCCQAGFACHPVNKGDRWYCTRPIENGGPCHNGPLEHGRCSTPIAPCHPKRTSAAKHKIIIQATLLAGVGLFFVILGAKAWSDKLQPGQLSSVHSGNVQCASCHENYQFTPLKSFQLLLTGKLTASNSQSCLQCHQLGEHPFSAHNQPIQEMEQRRSEKSQSKKSLTSIIDLSHLVLGTEVYKRQLACAACHKEHHGSQKSLLKMSEQTCQCCHKQTFSGMNEHPEFNHYPYRQRTHIVFDHNAHWNKYFKDEKYQQFAPKDCYGCHQLSHDGKFMMVKDYPVSCANCHDSEVIGQTRMGEKGLLVMNIPGLDLETLKNHHIRIGEWPANAEGQLSSVMVTILSQNPEFVAAYSKIRDLDLQDLSEASPQQLSAVAEVAWFIKNFLFDLSTHGTANLYHKISEVSNSQVDIQQHLPEFMPEDTLNAMLKIAFPHLSEEIQLHQKRADDTLNTHASDSGHETEEKSIAADDWQSRGGWYRDQMGIYFLPRYHADPFVVNWLNIVSQLNPKVCTLQKCSDFWFDPKAPGTCIKCHSVEKTQENGYFVHWQAKQSQPLNQFTAFSHKDHLSNMGKQGCETCHQLDTDADYLGSYKTFDPLQFHSNYKLIKRSTCSECHSEQNENDSCLLCHKYHVHGQ